MRVLLENVKQFFCGLLGHKYNGKNFMWSRFRYSNGVEVIVFCERCGKVLSFFVPEERLAEIGRKGDLKSFVVTRLRKEDRLEEATDEDIKRIFGG